ncbi:MAG: hypothetical protein IT423_23725, partial [Pirellulaceae bacterium]|nr:hypothetical protein [Pirellulaceae bacterium]
MNTVSQPGRIFRLCQKELRESLRDRRTIITLVLMPLLVYPLLSMILQRLLLTTSTNDEVDIVRIGLEDAELRFPLESAIAEGKHLLAVRGMETLSITRPDAPPTILTGEKANGQAAVQHVLKQNIELFHVQKNGRGELIAGAIDLLIRGTASVDVSPLRDPEAALGTGQEAPPNATGPPDASKGDPNAPPRARRSEILRE